MVKSVARTVLLLALCVAAVQGQGVPSSSECQNRANSIGQSGLLSQLSSCQSGATPECCSAAQDLLGFPGSGQLAGCLCKADVLEATLAGIDQNSLARAAGVGRAEVQQRFDACDIPNAARSGSCPSATAAPQATPAASPAASPAATPAATTTAAPVEAATGSPPPPPPPPADGKLGGWFPGKYLGMVVQHVKGRKLLQTSVDVSAPYTNVAVDTQAKSQASATGTASAASPAAAVNTNTDTNTNGGVGKGAIIAAVHQAAAAKAQQVADAVNQAYQAKMDQVNAAVKAAQDAQAAMTQAATSTATSTDQAAKHPLLAKLAMGRRL